MELHIETLTGSSMILHVSPLDTVFDVKTYIQKLEGIPASQQHLIWQSSELDDVQCLQDCHIHSGATLRLVLNMRGGPINIRRVPVEEPTLMEYFTEASRSDLLSSASSHRRPVTVVVCQSGDQLKFYQLMPESDMSAALSCSQSSSESDVEVAMPTNERREENRKTRDKMKLVRSQMERCSLLKETKDKVPPTQPLIPRPPSTGHPVFINRLRHCSSSGTSKKLDVVQKPFIPPPATPTATQEMSTQSSDYLQLSAERELPSVQTACADTLSTIASAAVDTETECQQREVRETTVKSSVIPYSSMSEDSLPSEAKSTCVIEDIVSQRSDVNIVATPQPKTTSATESKELIVSHGRIRRHNKPDESAESVTDAHLTRSISKSLRSSGRLPPDDLHWDKRCELDNARSQFACAVVSSSPAEQPTPTAVKRARARNEGNIMLRSLDSRQSRVVSGLLTSLVQSSGSRLASAGCYRLMRSGRNSSSLGAKSPQASNNKVLATTSAKGVDEAGSCQCSSVPSSTHLPAISAPETSTKRCLICNKKTSLATAFQCRCGGNFCGLHRYAEAHSCSFDYRSEGRRVIEQSNPLITAEKLPKL